jgi:hypothetical protein
MRRSCLSVVVALAVAAGAACDDSILPQATVANAVDSIELFALDGTAIDQPSAYDMTRLSPVRSDLTAAWDFAFNIDSLGRPVLASSHALGLGGGGGLLESNVEFENLLVAPSAGYITDSAVVVIPGMVLATRSRLITCELGTIFYYGKVRVIAIDLTTRTIGLEVLSNINCGYVSLEPGRPTR